MENIRYDIVDHVGWVTLDQPEKLNALTWGAWAEIESVVAEANDDDNVKCLVFTGEGRGFSSGTDLTNRTTEADWHPRPYTGRALKYRTRYRATATIYHCIKPTIAAVNGVAAGAGFSLALSCDMRIAKEGARLSAIFARRGIVADTGSTWLLPRIVGEARALEMLYSGRLVDAEEALRIGLVSEVVPADRFMERVTELARSFATGPSMAIELDKRLVRESWGRGLDEQIELEEYLQRITQGSEDAKEGRLSFLENRPARFTGH